MKRKKDYTTRISSMELKSLGVGVGSTTTGSRKKKDTRRREQPSAGQSKISDFVAGGTRDPKAGKLNVSFEGRVESFSPEELQLLGTLLQAKTRLSSAQLAMAVELWNTQNIDVFQFLSGENEGRPLTVTDVTAPLGDNAEHIFFRERTPNAPPVIHFADVKIGHRKY